MSRISLSASEQQFPRRKTRKRKFLEEMEALVPWKDLEAVIAPYYPKGKKGRPPIGVGPMLRMYCLQQWFNLSDKATEEGLYDLPVFAAFVGVDVVRHGAPDATTLLRFRHLLEEHNLTRALFDRINASLQAEGLLLKKGTVVDATIIEAASSTKNKDRARDPEMHSTKKGNQWYFGMKAHIGVDLVSGVVHTVEATSANVADVTVGPQLLCGEEEIAFADAGYQGVEQRCQEAGGETEWHVAEKRSKVRKLPKDSELRRLTEEKERLKAKVRARVEHPFHIIKRLFGYRKARYRGLAKNKSQLYILFGLANLILAERARHRRPGVICIAA